MLGGLHPPASVVQGWPSPNYTDPQRHAHTITVTALVCGIVATIVLFVRLSVRLGSTRNFGGDDALAIAAYVVSVGLAITCCLGEQLYGYDLHIWDVRPSQRAAARQATLAIELQFVVATSLVKLSMLVFFQRLMAGLLSACYRIVIGASMVIVALQLLGPGLVVLLQCMPLDAFWLQFERGWAATHPTAYCLDEGVFLLAISALLVLTDFLVALLPSILFWRMDMDVRQRLAFVLVFLVGVVLCAIGAARIFLIHKLYYSTFDTWDSSPLFSLTLAEPLVGFVVSSLPTLKIFFARILPGLWSAGYTYGSADDDVEMQAPTSPDHTTLGTATLGDKERRDERLAHRNSLESTTLGRGGGGGSSAKTRSLSRRGAPPGLATFYEDCDSDG